MNVYVNVSGNGDGEVNGNLAVNGSGNGDGNANGSVNENVM